MTTQIISFSFPAKRRLLTGAVAAFMAITTAISFPANAKEEADKKAVAFVDDMGKKALEMLTDQELSRDTREKRVRKLLNDHFDVPTIGKFALGIHWRKTDDKQKKEYLDLFENLIVQTYTTRFEDYSGQTFEVNGGIPLSAKDTIVNSTIIQEDGPPVDVKWRVRKKNASTYKIIDVVVENISMGMTQRSEFDSIIQRGGDIEALLESLREHKDLSALNKK